MHARTIEANATSREVPSTTTARLLASGGGRNCDRLAAPVDLWTINGDLHDDPCD